MKNKPIRYAVDKYIIIRDEYGNWSRTVPIEERTHPKGFSEYGLTPFEIALAEALIERVENESGKTVTIP
jgi:hypothetical protein